MRNFELLRPTTLEQLAQQAPSSERPLRSGGVDLIDRLKEGLEQPEQIVDLRRVSDPRLDGLGPTKGPEGSEGPSPRAQAFAIGARVRLNELAAGLQETSAYAALAQAAGQAATPSIRNMATVGGNLLQRPRCWYFRREDILCLKKGGGQCYAAQGRNRYHAILGAGPSWIVHPSSLATALVALGAEVEIHKLDSKQSATMGLESLFVLPSEDHKREHKLEPKDLLLRVLLPPAAQGQRSSYQAAREKASHDWPLAEAAVSLQLEGTTMRQVRVCLGHVAPVPWRSKEAEQVLEGKTADPGLFEQAAQAALANAKPLSENGYKVPMTQGLLRYALHDATGLPLPA